MNEMITIGNNKIGKGNPVYIIAELSANHNQDFNEAVHLIAIAKQAGANAVKIQTYTPDTMTIDCNRDCFHIGKGTVWEGKTLYGLYEEAYTPWEWQAELKRITNAHGMDFFSTPFDSTAVDFLETIGVPAYKLASFELVDIPLIEKIAQCDKPIIMSTGMATLSEIKDAVRTVYSTGNDQIILLKCTTAYPAPSEEMNLNTIPHLQETFNVPVGISDHTLGITVPIAAVTLGASIVEKHLTRSRGILSPDNAFSLEPDEFKTMVTAIRETEKALGTISYGPTEHELSTIIFRRSIFVVKDIQAGELFTEENIRTIRPGDGLSPKYFTTILGKKAQRDLIRGTPLQWEMVSPPS
jgi:pseudaminic acid synthase